MCADNNHRATASRFATPDAPIAPASARPVAPDAALLAELQAAGAEQEVLIRGGRIVTMDTALGDFRGDVLIRGGTIVEIGRDVSAPEAVVLDATGMIVAPGLVDSHVHAWLGQLRGFAPGVDFNEYMELTHQGIAWHYRPHDMYVGTLLTALQCLDSGVTTILDNSHNARSADHSSAAVEALFDAGIRAVHASGAPMGGAWDEQWPADLRRLRNEYCASEDQLVTLRMFDGYPVEDVWRFAKEEGLWISTEMGSHVTHLEQLRSADLLTPEHTFNHCFAITDHDWDLIETAGVRVNVCPRSDATFGLGFGRETARAALRRGIRPGISMDNEVSYGFDIFTEMQTLLLQQRARTFEAGFAEEDDVLPQLEPREILEFATIRGAENCALERTTGSLTPGKHADLVLVRTDDLNLLGLDDPVAALVAYANRANVDTVFVDGEVRKFRGELVGQDLVRLAALASTSRERLLAAHREAASPQAPA